MISLVIPNLGKIFEITGAVAAYPIDFVLPALVYAKICFYDFAKEEELHNLLTKNEKVSNLLVPQLVLPFFMVVLSIAASIISLYVIISTTDWSNIFQKIGRAHV